MELTGLTFINAHFFFTVSHFEEHRLVGECGRNRGYIIRYRNKYSRLMFLTYTGVYSSSVKKAWICKGLCAAVWWKWLLWNTIPIVSLSLNSTWWSPKWWILEIVIAVTLMHPLRKVCYGAYMALCHFEQPGFFFLCLWRYPDFQAYHFLIVSGMEFIPSDFLHAVNWRLSKFGPVTAAVTHAVCQTCCVLPVFWCWSDTEEAEFRFIVPSSTPQRFSRFLPFQSLWHHISTSRLPPLLCHSSALCRLQQRISGL